MGRRPQIPTFKESMPAVTPVSRLKASEEGKAALTLSFLASLKLQAMKDHTIRRVWFQIYYSLFVDSTAGCQE
ncbi:Uncharacterized protein DAT39_001742 [Clarias magur]|uniref:Uncharacterized protein n=1 Tax=Clarias magur TaxID=1594786 RepID=A0A8J4UVA4_CLAMG|nr:Uncharacterized protein DAT39_001742 [Clarias magur]